MPVANLTPSIAGKTAANGIAGYMGNTKMNNYYSPIDPSNMTFSGTDSEDKRGLLFGSLNFGGEVVNGYYLSSFKQGYSYSGSSYTLQTQGVRDTQMQQNDATSNVVRVPSNASDQSDMTAALNKGVELYNAASPLYGVTAKTWVKNSSYAYPVLSGSPLAQ